MNTVRAKFTCVYKEPNSTGKATVSFNPSNTDVMDSGSISLTSVTEAAATQFEVGKKYNVVFSLDDEAPTAAEAPAEAATAQAE